MRRWWLWGRKPQPRLTPEVISATIAKPTRSVIVHFGEAKQPERFYWQLRRHDHVKDLAIRALRLTDRNQALPLTATAVEEFLTAVDGQNLEPLYLLQVPTLDIDRGVLAQLAGCTAIPQQNVVNLVMPAQVMFDFLANGASDDYQMPVSVAELLDGWPMKESQTLEAFLQQAPETEPKHLTPLPDAVQITLGDWQQADQQITELFDAPLKQAATTAAGTFVFTDVD
ncbi:hypothetical protein [Lacticaseibacillus porcinae]|uniref:hypothetical protein n=1 Tax=Lacticaseibacillus porcinae TaxID=1123687 RepID=UPI000F793E06|nr:hypothetical protein [Lacticaseibacillus porcinae]